MPYRDPKKRSLYHKKWRKDHIEHLRKYNDSRRELTNKMVKEKRHRVGISKKYNFSTTGIRSVARYRSRGKEYSENWNEIRWTVYKRDNWTCMECGVKCHCNNRRDKIQCHHIDYDIKNNKMENLITLCVCCHAKTNYSQSDWQQYFMKKVRKHYV